MVLLTNSFQSDCGIFLDSLHKRQGFLDAQKTTARGCYPNSLLLITNQQQNLLLKLAYYFSLFYSFKETRKLHWLLRRSQNFNTGVSWIHPSEGENNHQLSISHSQSLLLYLADWRHGVRNLHKTRNHS